ncbi:ankyrin repeat-containing domain protein [Pilobolus umbonatus]|nr:ankyrin repeat-containing domain protein [Pilobolus umbonatus]
MSSKDNLWVAAGDGQLDRVKELIESGVDVNSHDQFGYTAMHAAVSYNQIEVVEYLITKGADINVRDYEKDTPLFVAETVRMADLLIKNGADPYLTNESGITAASTALEEGWEEVAHYIAKITKEELIKTEEEDGLAHLNVEENEMASSMQAIMQQIQQQGDFNEEEVTELVTKMLLEQLKKTS